VVSGPTPSTAVAAPVEGILTTPRIGEQPAGDAPVGTRGVPRWVFTVTIFAGSFLLFQVQPMVARLALPDLGGAPAVWNSAMLVYQALLLAGYGWAHWLHRFPVRRQVLMHLGLLLLACLWLPVGLASMEPPTGGSVVLFVPLLFLVSVGPVVLVVSAQAPMMQGWFAAGHGGNPYPLYAASNLGSFSGLLAYPLLVEPALGLQAQRWSWTVAYGGLVALVAACGVVAARRAGSAHPATPGTGELPAAPIPRRRTWTWLALSAVPSGLMLSTTTHISTDIMAMPLLWAIPLGLYLLSFTVAFADRRGPARVVTRVAPWLLMAIGSFALLSKGLPGYPVAVVSLVALFAVSVALHSRLYESRPPASQLTRFYLTTSVGGALGGLFCGLVAPVVFDWVYEHPILVVAAAALMPLGGRSGGVGTIRRRVVYVTTLVSLMVALGGPTTIPGSFNGDRARSYFGVYTVGDTSDGTMRTLVHGGTTHGLQLLSPASRRNPTMYYGPDSGVGSVLSHSEELFGTDAAVGVVGLGAGTLACYRQPGETWTFFEIDPLVVEIARDSGKFTFLADCAPDATITVGDARLELGKVGTDTFDVLAVDAFSSDAIPMHLMTREAFDLYDRVVRDDGLVLVHITNRFLDLEPVLAALVRDEKWAAAVLDHKPSADEIYDLGYANSRWVALARSSDVLEARLGLTGEAWRELSGDQDAQVWTDDHASVLPVLR
jgi:hypothetical protein